MRTMPDFDLTTAIWHKSSYSGGGGGNCLEVARWRKSTYSGGGGDNCLEVGDGLPAVIPVRDSKTPLGPALVFRAEAWSLFVEDLRRR
ncbi:DUF397 domain-containing protein [Streptomyces sp. NPDC101112]|uniref:DUF397 domain-containing protein n=1 Tax=unclassified Streptomyces TaxID=2593676 RepID=UPI000D1AB44B|nr:DUF397 domain-containing protein [Streptomyces sp. MA5143a]SPF05457.1 hypothetical protein SMA5143A_6270 [Streptomyces sp. MA5143a]